MQAPALCRRPSAVAMGVSARGAVRPAPLRASSRGRRAVAVPVLASTGFANRSAGEVSVPRTLDWTSLDFRSPGDSNWGCVLAGEAGAGKDCVHTACTQSLRCSGPKRTRGTRLCSPCTHPGRASAVPCASHSQHIRTRRVLCARGALYVEGRAWGACAQEGAVGGGGGGSSAAHARARPSYVPHIACKTNREAHQKKTRPTHIYTYTKQTLQTTGHQRHGRQQQQRRQQRRAV